MMQKNLWRVGATLALSAFVLVGCGDDDDDTPGGTGGMGGSATGGAATGGAATGGSATGGSATGGGGMGGQTQQDIVDTADAAGSFTTLISLLEQADLVDTLRGAGPFTVFAPTDAAFAAFEAANPGVLGGLSDDEVSNVLRYHVVSGEVMSTDLTDGQVVETLADGGATFTVNLDGGVTITDGSGATEDANVTNADVDATNGVIHVIDAVLLPPAP
jgi:uncharacterized surface protein with fasciclin (FAS1) repeats